MNTRKPKYPTALPLQSSMISIYCREQNDFYTLEDFDEVDKIDTHIHVNTNRDAFIEQGRKNNFKGLNIVVDLSTDPEFIKEQYDFCIDQKTRHPDDFEVATSFSIKEWDDPYWVPNTISWLAKSFKEGAVGVKVWKNIGMDFRNKNGELVMIDDPKFDPIFNYITEQNKVLVGHLGEPKNCWLHLDEMTTNNDRDYVEKHPQYHMYKHPELPTYEEQIAARDRMLERNPKLVFVGAHMGSMSWSVDEVAKRLDKFPNMYIDLAARIGQVFHQTIGDREKVRNFFIKYQDRILYATDLTDDGSMDADELKIHLHETWLLDWRFFVTDDVMTGDDYFNEHTWLWDGKPHWAYDNPEYILLETDRNAIEWTPNTITSQIKIVDQTAQIDLTSNTPNLKEYQMKVLPSGKWQKVDNSIKINLTTDVYEVVFRTINVVDVTGPEHLIKITVDQMRKNKK